MPDDGQPEGVDFPLTPTLNEAVVRALGILQDAGFKSGHEVSLTTAINLTLAQVEPKKPQQLVLYVDQTDPRQALALARFQSYMRTLIGGAYAPMNLSTLHSLMSQSLQDAGVEIR